MTKIILIRHGYSLGNKEKKFTGQMDLPLDRIGRAQAMSVCEYVKEHYQVDWIYSSDLSRARDTVAPLAKALSLPIHECRELREVDVGLWQGMLIEEVAKTYPENFALYKKKPGLVTFDGGESYGALIARVRPFIEKLAEEKDGKTLVIATHGGVIRNLRAAWDGVELAEIERIPHVPNASLSVLHYENGRVTWQSVGEVAHLADRTTEEGVR